MKNPQMVVINIKDLTATCVDFDTGKSAEMQLFRVAENAYMVKLNGAVAAKAKLTTDRKKVHHHNKGRKLSYRAGHTPIDDALRASLKALSNAEARRLSLMLGKSDQYIYHVCRTGKFMDTKTYNKLVGRLANKADETPETP